jgi:hypothetical protein
MVNSSQIHKALAKRLLSCRLFYVCRDIERAFVSNPPCAKYYIITNHTAYSAKLAKQYSNIILIKNKSILDTAQLLQHPITTQKIKSKDLVLVFKNNTIIESICHEKKWKLLNPSSQLADKIESKISQVQWLGALAKFLPPHTVTTCAKIHWRNKKFILQFNHSHTGSGTFLISSASQLKQMQQKFPHRPVRTMDFIEGPVFTNNNIVWGDRVFRGNINYQITGIVPFTDNPFTTIGNDWQIPSQILDKKQTRQYATIVNAIGKKMNKQGWKGLFGIDVILDKKAGTMHLLEINARQPASTTFESQLQASAAIQNANLSLITTFEAHLAALLDVDSKDYNLITIHNGAQIVQRVTNTVTNINKIKLKNTAIINIIKYKNKSLGSDLVRIQSNAGIMKAPDVLNELGNIISLSLC